MVLLASYKQAQQAGPWGPQQQDEARPQLCAETVYARRTLELAMLLDCLVRGQHVVVRHVLLEIPVIMCITRVCLCHKV